MQLHGLVDHVLAGRDGGVLGQRRLGDHLLAGLAELSAVAIEKARAYERLVDAEELLRQNEKLSALGELSAGLAHEMNQPLNGIRIVSQSLIRDIKIGLLKVQGVTGGFRRTVGAPRGEPPGNSRPRTRKP